MGSQPELRHLAANHRNVVGGRVMPSQGRDVLLCFPQVVKLELSVWDFVFMGKDRASKSWLTHTW